jgi:hypothetical protein
MSVPKAADLFEQKSIAPVMTDEQIAAHMGLSKGRVFQLRMRAMAKIRAMVLEDQALREMAEDLVGRELPPAERCDSAGCDTPLDDVRTVAYRRGNNRFIDNVKMCTGCRQRNNGNVKVVR